MIEISVTTPSPNEDFSEHDLVASSGLFDEVFYTRQWPDDERLIEDPIGHFLHVGWHHNVDPCPQFCIQHYLSTYDDVKASAMNPLLHYIKYGKAEGRLPFQSRATSKEVSAPASAPIDDEWKELLASFTADAEPVVDVIVPVYRGYDETARCLYSVLSARQETQYRLIVIDDYSPERQISELLQKLSDKGVLELHANARNRGFVKSCNYAMELHQDRDIVLLNSDTEVFGNWLDRLKAAALADPTNGTVTPFSNNAEICSYPKFIHDNWNKLEISDAQLDQLAAQANAGKQVEIPTGVGFCMFIRRVCLDTAGLFDEKQFGKGYGEENDLCRRIAAAGWRNIMTSDVFVRHYGAASFGASKAARVNAAVQLVEELHPGYLQMVADFIAADPIRPYREALDIARLNYRSKRGPILFVTHRRGGGTERHARELAAKLEADGVKVVFCRTHASDPNKICLEDCTAELIPNLPQFNVLSDMSSFISYLKKIRIDHVHIHHLADFPQCSPDFFRMACQGAGLNYDFTVHDYMSVCPRINLIDDSGIYCAEPDIATCETCILHNGSPFGHPAVWDWRERYSRLLHGARRIFVPDMDVAQRMRRFHASLEFTLKPHEITQKAAGHRSGPKKRSTYRIAVLGAIGPHKGSILLADVATASQNLDLPLEFVVVGYTDRDNQLNAIGNVICTGPYEEHDAETKLLDADADIAWFPAVWPETYSYTLSTALIAGIYPVGFDFGAIGSRIQAAGWGKTIPIDLMMAPNELAQILLNEAKTAKLQPSRQAVPVTYNNVLTSYYALTDDANSHG